jgi:D-alanine-D-alanine ligase
MAESVLIIYNDVEKNLPNRESNAGVLDEVGAVTAALKKLSIDYEVVSIGHIRQLPDVLERHCHRIVFNLIEELPDSIVDACYVPAICSAYGRACTGGDTPALLLTQDKWKTKAVLRAADIPCPQGVIVPIGQKFAATALTPGRYIVKPVLSDASEGISPSSIVELSGEDIHKAVDRIHAEYHQPAIVEQFIAQRELNVSVLQLNGKVEVLPIAEIDFAAFDAARPRIVDYDAKWRTDSFAYNNTSRIIPAHLSGRTAQTVRRCALAAWRQIGCRDYARVDFRMDDKDNIFILEINLNPDISPDAGFAAALQAGGITYEKFIDMLINNALLRLG